MSETWVSLVPEGSVNAAHILKPALSRGEIRVIGATTLKEYRKCIEKDSALERRFQPVKVDEPSVDETVEIIRGIKSYYESFHGVFISDEVARFAATLSERYITDRYLPDKAIDLLDEACATAALQNTKADEYAKLLLTEQNLQKQESDIMAGEEVDYEKLANVRADLMKTQQAIEAVRLQAVNAPLTEEHLAKDLPQESAKLPLDNAQDSIP